MVANKPIDTGGGQKEPMTGSGRAPDLGAGSGRPLADVELTMADLVGDDHGEIVFFNDSGFRTLAIETECAVVADGRAESHVTAGGANVTGFQYVTFDNGLTLYYEQGLDLVVPGREPGTP